MLVLAMPFADVGMYEKCGSSKIRRPRHNIQHSWILEMQCRAECYPKPAQYGTNNCANTNLRPGMIPTDDSKYSDC